MLHSEHMKILQLLIGSLLVATLYADDAPSDNLVYAAPYNFSPPDTVVRAAAARADNTKKPIIGELRSYMAEVESAWTSFKKKFNKVFKSAAEEEKRLINFVSSYLHVKHHNSRYRSDNLTFILGLNHLSDWSPKEVQRLLGFRYNPRRDNISAGSTYLSSATGVTVPSSVDWRGTGAVSEVKNQGACGSCWAFSTTGSLEGQTFRKKGRRVDLSEQQLVDCSHENNGCHGGIMDLAFNYVQKNGGLDSEKAYPYVSGDTHEAQDTCRFRPKDVLATDTGHMDLPSGDEEKLKEAVATVGPISVAIDASHRSFQMYASGVYDEIHCGNGTRNLDHGVLVVGYGTDKLAGKDYWLVKNSWGPQWGENGYIRMRRNARNQCGIATMASYPLV